MATLRPLTSVALCATLFCSPSAARADEPEEPPWYKKFQLGAFVDANFSWNFNNPKPPGEDTGLAVHRNAGSGFHIAWAGGDLSYPAEPVGGTISLRFGPMATANGGKDTEVSLHYLLQAFVSYKPIPQLQLDFGKFTTIFGAEMAEAHLNFNYTQGLLYWMLQPSFHTGFKITWAITDHWALTGMVANGWDNSVDFNSGKSGGLQVSWTPVDNFNILLGYLFGPEQNEFSRVICASGTRYNSTTGTCVSSPGSPGEIANEENEGANDRFRHLADLVISYQPTGWLSLILASDFVAETFRDENDQDTTLFAYGVSLAAQFNIHKYFGVAVRGEYLNDSDGWSSGRPDLNILSGTITLEGRATRHLTARLETRVDGLDQSLFRKDLSDWNNIQVVTIFGVIVAI